MPVLRGLYLSEHEVADAESSAFDVSVMVAPQGLLILGRVEKCDVASLVELVDCIFERRLVPLFVVGLDPWGIVLEVDGQHSLGPIHQEERGAARGSTRHGPQAPHHRGELGDPF